MPHRTANIEGEKKVSQMNGKEETFFFFNAVCPLKEIPSKVMLLME